MPDLNPVDYKTAREDVQNTHHGSGRIARATENTEDRAGSRRHCVSGDVANQRASRPMMDSALAMHNSRYYSTILFLSPQSEQICLIRATIALRAIVARYQGVQSSI